MYLVSLVRAANWHEFGFFAISCNRKCRHYIATVCFLCHAWPWHLFRSGINSFRSCLFFPDWGGFISIKLTWWAFSLSMLQAEQSQPHAGLLFFILSFFSSSISRFLLFAIDWINNRSRLSLFAAAIFVPPHLFAEKTKQREKKNQFNPIWTVFCVCLCAVCVCCCRLLGNPTVADKFAKSRRINPRHSWPYSNILFGWLCSIPCLVELITHSLKLFWGGKKIKAVPASASPEKRFALQFRCAST